MVLIPRFELSQNENTITIKIYAPYTKIADTEIYVDKEIFYFHSQPYFLRLKLPGEIEENDSSRAKYDWNVHTFVLEFDKVNKGEHFEGLDMITTLLAPPKNSKKNIVPTIEVIENHGAAESNDLESVDEDESGDYWHLPQSAPSPSVILPNAPKYGFANKISGALSAFDEGLLKDVINLPNPDTTPMNERKALREADEFQHFSDDHYLTDTIAINETITPLINFIPEWYNLTSNDITYTDREKDILKELPNKEFLLDSEESQIVMFGLVDILFGSCYTYRVTIGENTVESSWDINTISATLSWFATFDTMEEVIISAIKRILCYALYRNWELSLKVFDDVKTVMKLGKKYILKRFCEIYELFNNSFEPRYLHNQLYIRDYLIYIQQASDSLIEQTAESLTKITPTKASMNLYLDELECAAVMVLKKEKKRALKANKLAKKSSEYTDYPEYSVNSLACDMIELSCNDEKSSATTNNIESDDTTTSSDESSTTISNSSSFSSNTTSDSSETDTNSETDSNSDSSETDSNSDSSETDSDSD